MNKIFILILTLVILTGGKNMGVVYISRELEESIIELRIKKAHDMDVGEFVKKAIEEKIERMENKH